MEETLNHTPPPFKEIIDLIETLRGDNGCPWDRKQTFESLRNLTIEETYELADAIERDLAESSNSWLKTKVRESRPTSEPRCFLLTPGSSGTVIRGWPAPGSASQW